MASRRGSALKGSSRYAPYRPSQPSSAAATSSALAIPTAIAGGTWRDVCLRIASDQYPGFKPRNDFEIFTLGSTRNRGSHPDLGTWLDLKLAQCVERQGSIENVMKKVRNALNQPSNTITGLKPGRGDRNVFVRPIPHSSYSIRLFPGCFDAREYCIDFVDTRTGNPVNSPFKFELWSIADPSTPWLDPGSFRVTSLESAFGLPQDEISPGHEKFVVRDGQTCLLKRPGRKDVRFTVPVRTRPAAAVVRADDVDELDLPASVVA